MRLMSYLGDENGLVSGYQINTFVLINLLNIKAKESYKMKKLAARILVIALTSVGLIACGGTPQQPAAETVTLSSAINVKELDLNLTFKHTPEIKYHTQEELTSLVTSLLKTKLKEKQLLSTAPEADSIVINVDYFRRFLGDATPLPSDSLAAPEFEYQIKLAQGQEMKTVVSRDNLVYKPGFASSLKIIGGGLRDKEDELPFVEALVNTLIDDIEKNTN